MLFLFWYLKNYCNNGTSTAAILSKEKKTEKNLSKAKQVTVRTRAAEKKRNKIKEIQQRQPLTPQHNEKILHVFLVKVYRHLVVVGFLFIFLPFSFAALFRVPKHE